ncbi:MAG: YfhO family protein [Chitinophagales bacterium]|nr:YfhO family protein [Chitinophagales bacterium]
MSTNKKNVRPVHQATKANRNVSEGQNLFETITSGKYFHLIAVGLFIVVSLIYCYPVLSGKKLNAGDLTAGEAFNREFKEYQGKVSEFIGWTNTMFSGMPRAGSSVEKFNYPYRIVHLGLSIFKTISFEQLIWLMIGFYLLLIALQVRRWWAFVGAICFALTTFNITSIEAGHALKVFAIACVPAILAGIIWVKNKEYLKGFIVFTLFLNFLLTINHTQITYYAIIACFIYVVFAIIDLAKNGEFKHIAMSGGMLLLGAGLCGGANLHLLNFYNMSKETMRGGNSELAATNDANQTKGEKTGLDKDYALSWSYGKLESLSFLIPNIMGGQTKDALVYDKDSETYTALVSSGDPNANQLAQASTPYWGDQPFVGGPIYFGAILMMLFVFGLLTAKSKDRWWLLGVGIFFLFISWGRNFSLLTDLLFDHAPLYNKFRTPSMGQSILQIGILAIAFLGLNRLISEKDKHPNAEKFLYISGGITAGICLLVMLMPKIFGSFEAPNDGQLPDWMRTALVSDRIAIAKKDAFRSLILIMLGAGLVWAYIKEKINANILIPVLSILVIGDLWSVDHRYFNKDSFKSPSELSSNIQPTTADQQIMSDPDPNYRVFNTTQNPFNDAATSFFHKSIGGYSAVKLLRYQELIDAHISKGNMGVLSMLNMKYFIVQNPQDGTPVAQPNPAACGNGWFVDTLYAVKTAKEVMDGMGGAFNPKSKALIQDATGAIKTKTYAKDSTAQIKLTNYLPHKLSYVVNNANDGFAVFSEVYYKQEDGDGWVAKLDGKDVEIQRVNYLLRGIEIPKGKHTLEMAMVQPAAGRRGMISMLCLLVLTILWVGGVIMKDKFQRKENLT